MSRGMDFAELRSFIFKTIQNEVTFDFASALVSTKTMNKIMREIRSAKR